MTRAGVGMRVPGPLTRLLGVRILLDVQFWFPTWMLFLLGQGYSPLQAAAVDAVFHGVLVIAEFPLGRLVDRIGRRRALLTSCAGTAVVFAGIGLVTSVWLMAVVWALWGALWALGSGLDTTYAWELAEADGRISPTRYLGMTRLAGGIAGLVSLVSAGFLLEVWPPLPYVLTACLAVLALLIAVTVPSVQGHRRPSSPDGSTAASSLRSALHEPLVRIGIVLGAIVLTAGITIRIVLQPLGSELGLGAREISLAYGGIALTVAAGGWTATRIRRRRWGTGIAASICAMAVGYLAVAAGAASMPSWVTMLVLVPLSTAAFGLGKTLTDLWLVDVVGPPLRNTVLSLASAANGLTMVGLRPVVVQVGDVAGNGVAFGLWGAVTLALALLTLLLLRAPSRGKHSVR